MGSPLTAGHGPDALHRVDTVAAMSELEVRVAQLSDVDAVVALVESAYRGDSSRAGWTTEADLLDGQRTDPDAVREIVAGAGSLVLLGTSGGRLVACCELRGQPGGTAYFGMFAVVPTLQGAGLGGRLLAEAERLAVQQWSATTMEMTVIRQRAELIAWYERRGYRRTGETRPFPHGDQRYGLPRRRDLEFAVLAKPLPGRHR